MQGVDWRAMELDAGVLVESAGDDGRVVLWTPLERDGGYQYWDRVGTGRRAEVRVRGGFCWTPATAIRARRRESGGAFSRLVGMFGGGGAGSWVMPDGKAAERCGDRRADLALVWPEDGRGALDEGALRGLLPGDVRFRRIGGRLVLASGVAGEAEPAEVEGRAEIDEARAEVGDEEAATRRLETAREAGDRLAEAAALADLALVRANAGEPVAAVGPLERAREIFRELGDRAGEADALIDLGRVHSGLRSAVDARRALEEAGVAADGLADPLAKAAALERLGEVYARLGDPDAGDVVLDRALDAARSAGSARHEARILWLRAAAAAELRRPDQALAHAEASATLLRSTGDPSAPWYESQIEQYRSGASPATGPGVLRMALTASKAMATFLGSGMQATAAEVQQGRLASCRACPHYTGLRCRVCGCFTAAKTRLPHERCPVGRW